MIDLMGKLYDETSEETAKDDSEFFEVVHKRYNNAKEIWEQVFTFFRGDVEFEGGDMWDSSLKSKRKVNNLSCLTVNKISPKVKYIVNNARAAMPSIKVRPIKDGASENTAKVFDGIIKSIEYQGNTKQARIFAHKQNVIGGLGAWRDILYVNEEGYPDIKSERILDPTTILIDPNAKEQDFSDAKYAFVTTWISKDEFQKEYKDVDVTNYSKDNNSWYSQDSVQVVEYWCKGDDGLFDQYLITADKILKEVTDYPGKYLPIYYLTGEESSVGGERGYKGIVRDVKDMQMLHNLTKSRTADYIARSAEAQWLVEAEMIADYKDIWQKANVSGSPVLPYTATSAGGKPARVDPLTPPTGLLEASSESDEDIRMTIGIRDPLADVPSSQSGKAIQLQIAQGNIGTFEYADKLNDLIKYQGKVLVDLIPKVFNYAHIREIMGEDGEVTPVQLNQPYIDNGEQVMHDLSKGKYMVTISTGASYESQRSETADKLIELVGKYPEMMQLAGDLIVRNMDFVGKDDLADRLKAAIPPNILAATNASNGDKAEAQVAQMNAQMQQMGLQMQQMQEALQQAQQLNMQLQQDQQTKATETQIRTQAELAIMENKSRSDLVALQTKAQFDEHVLALKNAHEREMKLLELQLTGQQKIEQLHIKGDIDAKLQDVKADNDLKALDTKAQYDDYAADNNAEHEINKIHVQNYANIYLEEMRAEIEMDVKKQTGIDLID